MKQVEHHSGAYEVLLCFPDGRCELRLTDHIDLFLRGDDTLMLRGEPWLIVDEQEPALAAARRRFVCEPLQVLTAPPRRTPHAAQDFADVLVASDTPDLDRSTATTSS
jgi:hypothetical protein